MLTRLQGYNSMVLEGKQHHSAPKLRLTHKQSSKDLVNSKVVELIKDKLLPLNRLRYEHLQKINKAVRKDKSTYLEAIQATVSQHHTERDSHRKKAVMTSRELENQKVTDLLLERLKSLKKIDLGGATTRLRKRPVGYKCWSNLQEDIAACQMAQTSRVQTPDQAVAHTKRGKQSLIDLVQKAQRHLRLRKHQLRQTYRAKEEGHKHNRHQNTYLQGVIHTLGIGLRGPRPTVMGQQQQQMEREMLRDVRTNMLEQKMNRLKRDINHKKIVQLR